jgi:hypothetical protein
MSSKIKTQSTKNKVIQAIKLHDRMKNAYWFHPVSPAQKRRWYEQQNSMAFSFKFQGNVYEVNLETECTCRHVKYRSDIRVNGQKKNIRSLKNIV